MIEVKVNPGICGFNSLIKAESSDMTSSSVRIESECPAVKQLAAKIKTVDAMKEVFSPFGTSSVFTEAAKVLNHSACPVPTAVIKAIEASCSLALPADVNIQMKKTD